MKALVTGGAGFIGSHIVDALIEEGHEVTVIDDLSTGKKENVNSKAKFVLADIGNDESMAMASEEFKGIDVVFHLAAKARVQPSIADPKPFHKSNVDGTFNVLLASKEAGVRRVVSTSSSSIYGDGHPMPIKEEFVANPMSPYALNKLIGEQYCKIFSDLYGLETVCLRYFNVYGPRQPISGAYCSVMGIFAGQLLAGESMTIVGDGEQRRDFTYVGDVVRANLLASTSDKVGKGEAINIGNGDNRSVNQIAKIFDGPTINMKPRIEPRETLADNTLAKKLLGWHPTTDVDDWLNNYKVELGLDEKQGNTGR